jgi:hypothetical protein
MEYLTCADFAGPCCNSCHEDMAEGISDVPIEVYDKKDRLVAKVCCIKVAQAELRAEGITEAIK